MDGRKKVCGLRVELLGTKIKAYKNFSFANGGYIKILFVLLQRTIIAMFIVVEVRRVLS